MNAALWRDFKGAVLCTSHASRLSRLLHPTGEPQETMHGDPVKRPHLGSGKELERTQDWVHVYSLCVSPTLSEPFVADGLGGMGMCPLPDRFVMGQHDKAAKQRVWRWSSEDRKCRPRDAKGTAWRLQ